MDSTTPKESQNIANTTSQNTDIHQTQFDEDEPCSNTLVSDNALLPFYLKTLTEFVETDNTPPTTTETEIQLESSVSSISLSNWSQPNLVDTENCYLCNPPRKRNFKDLTTDIRSKFLKYTSKPTKFYLKIQPLNTSQDPISDYILIPFEANRVDISDTKVDYVGNRTNIIVPLSPFNRPYISTVDISEYRSRLYANKHLKGTNYPGIEVKNKSFVEFSIWNNEGTQIQLASYDVFTEFIDIALSPGFRRYIKYENKTQEISSSAFKQPLFGNTHSNFEVELCLLNYGTRLFLINSIKLAFNFSTKMEVSARQALITDLTEKPVHLDHDIWYLRKKRSADIGVIKFCIEMNTPLGCLKCLTKTVDGYSLIPEIGDSPEYTGPEVEKIREKVKANFDTERKEQEDRLNTQIEFLRQMNLKWNEKRHQ